jgi:hypothetical protein
LKLALEEKDAQQVGQKIQKKEGERERAILQEPLQIYISILKCA